MTVLVDSAVTRWVAAGLALVFAAWVLGIITQKLKLSPIVGYLLAGIVIGPYTPGIEADTGLALQLAEIGVMLLMFGVGLHFHLDDLLAVKGIAMKVLIKSAWGSEDPTKAVFAFLHANAFAEAGHEVQIFLLGEAVNLMKDELMSSVTPVGWPPLSEIMPKTFAAKIPLNV